MGATCRKGGAKYSFINLDHPDQLAQNIKQLDSGDLLSMLADYIEFNTYSQKLQWLKEANCYWQKISKEHGVREGKKAKRISTNSEAMAHHMNEISKRAQFCDDFINKVYQEQKQTSKKVKQLSSQWKKQFKEKINQSRKSMKIKPEIELSDHSKSSNYSEKLYAEQRKNSNNREQSKSISQRRPSPNNDFDDYRKRGAHSTHYQNCKEQIIQMQSTICSQNEKIRRYEKCLEESVKIGDHLKDKIRTLQMQIESLIQENNKLILIKSQLTDKNQLLENQMKNLRAPSFSNKLQQKNTNTIQIERKVFPNTTNDEDPRSKSKTQRNHPSEGKGEIKKLREDSFMFNILGQSTVLFLKEYEDGFKYRQIISNMFSSKPVRRSQKIFQYDPVQNNHLMSYITGKEHLLFLGKLNNGRIVGTYSSGNYLEDQERLTQNQCFLFSIANTEKSMKLVLKDKNRAKYSIKLDRNYLKFGSNELRIRCETDEGYSNLGTRQDLFYCPEQEANIKNFLGVSERAFHFSCYEIHQLFFSQQQG